MTYHILPAPSTDLASDTADFERLTCIKPTGFPRALAIS
jgi:hypothetical protein